MRHHLNDNFSVITIRIRMFDFKNIPVVEFRRDLARMLIQICVNPGDSPILWQDDIIKLILEVPSSKLPQIRDTIAKMLNEQFNQRNQSINMQFKSIKEDIEINES